MADYEWRVDDDLGPEDLEPVSIYDDELEGILDEFPDDVGKLRDELAEYDAELGGEG